MRRSLALTRKARFNPARPWSIGAFAAQWRREVGDARRFGRERVPGRYLEMDYGELVADPDRTVRGVCNFLDLEFDPAMLEYHRETDAGYASRPPAAGRAADTRTAQLARADGAAARSPVRGRRRRPPQ